MKKKRRRIGMHSMVFEKGNESERRVRRDKNQETKQRKNGKIV